MDLGSSDIQRHVGRRLSERRAASGMSQEELASRLGVSVTELGLFETGMKPIPPRRLILAAETLKTSLASLLEGAPMPPCGRDLSSPSQQLVRFLAMPEAYALVAAFIAIPDREQRQGLVDAARALAAQAQDGPKGQGGT